MKRPLGYVDGIGAGIAALALLVALLLAMASPKFAAMYRDMGDYALPATTKLVLSTAWRVVVPAALITAFVCAHVWRPRYMLVALAVAAIAIDAFWYFAAYAPIFELSGNIR